MVNDGSGGAMILGTSCEDALADGASNRGTEHYVAQFTWARVGITDRRAAVDARLPDFFWAGVARGVFLCSEPR